MKKILQKLKHCLMLINLVGCASGPVVTKFDADWEFLQSSSGQTKACLSKDDVNKLKETLIRCKAAQ
jgi:hypothetical protein